MFRQKIGRAVCVLASGAFIEIALLYRLFETDAPLERGVEAVLAFGVLFAVIYCILGKDKTAAGEKA